MTENNIQLEERLVGKIEGEFYVPSYQRGYRWDENQVKALLDDVYDNGENSYCLQPIVVRKGDDGRYELIDGQQRLTTLYIIYKFMTNRWPDYIENVNYTLSYETRQKNDYFFNNIENEDIANSNIDFFFIHQAYKTVEKWFALDRGKKPLHVAGKLSEFFDNNVKVIWYEMESGSEADAISLFTRLNIGRIPLTNAELVKALFLRKDKEKEKCPEGNRLEEKRQLEISLQWDTIERELHDDDFWYFLTKKNTEGFPTRIELLFDFIASQRENKTDPLSIFLYFNKRKNEGEDLSALWEEIVRYYYRLKEWYKKDTLYHRIGYIVASGHMTMNQIVDATINLKKSEQEKLLDEEIRKSIVFPRVKYSELRYDTTYDYISRLLLLFNVVSVMNYTHFRFPFRIYNTEQWSLEHIHPQHPEEMKNDQKLWKEWMRIQKISIAEYPTAEKEGEQQKKDLVNEIDRFCSKEKVSKEDFKALSDKVVQFLSDNYECDTHSLSNMALLSKSQNSALNNSLFDAKRREIIEMDKRGEFIPYCTRNVFLKYYTDSKKVQMAKWSKEDREGYIAAMNKVLEPYKAEEITA